MTAGVRTCGHCGQECWISEAGFASWNGIPICNPEAGLGRMQCYDLIKQFHHDIPCQPCRKIVKEGGSLDLENSGHVQRHVDDHSS